MKKYYVVIPTDEITQEMVTESINKENTIRMCNDCSFSILKFDTMFPNTMSGRIKKTHAQILDFLKVNSFEWDKENV